MKKTLIAIGVFLLLGVSAFFLASRPAQSPTIEPPVNTPPPSEEPSAPIGYEDKSNLIKNVNVKPGSYIQSPLTITGEARGYWYFEATFPIVIVNWDGLIIAEGFATAQSEWMTTDFVPFEATINFPKPDYGENGAVILQKSNASGLSQFDDALEIPIKFK